MSIYQEVLFLVFFIVGGMIVLDANVGTYILLKIQQAGINIQRAYWIVRLHPNNPITNYFHNKRLEKLTKEFTHIPPEDRVDL